MSGKCKVKDCTAPELPCHDGLDDYKLCPNFILNTTEKIASKERIIVEKKNSRLTWDAQPLSINNISLVSGRSSPILVGIIGKADAGKTSFLAMVYSLLLNGKKLKDYEFSGTKTILGWDELHNRLKLRRGAVPFPPPTPVTSNLVYHLALRNKDNQLKDVLFADASGEVFTLWATNRNDDNAESARWIYKNSNAFLLFIDCEALIEEKNLAKREILMIARQLSHDLQNRTVIAVWSKSDRKKEVLPSIVDSLKKELKNLFENYLEIEISNFLEPGPDELVHKNNLEAIDLLLENEIISSNADITLKEFESKDLFINFKKK